MHHFITQTWPTRALAQHFVTRNCGGLFLVARLLVCESVLNLSISQCFTTCSGLCGYKETNMKRRRLGWTEKGRNRDRYFNDIQVPCFNKNLNGNFSYVFAWVLLMSQYIYFFHKLFWVVFLFLSNTPVLHRFVQIHKFTYTFKAFFRILESNHITQNMNHSHTQDINHSRRVIVNWLPSLFVSARYNVCPIQEEPMSFMTPNLSSHGLLCLSVWYLLWTDF